MNWDICTHLWHHHHHQSNKTNPTLPEVSCIPLFLLCLFLFVVRTLTMRSTLLTKFEVHNTIFTMGFVIQSIFYLELEDQRTYFQILLQLIRGSSFNSGVRNEILILKKKQLSSDFKKFFLYLFLAALGLRCWAAFSLVSESRACSLAVVHGLLTVMAGFSCCWAWAPGHVGFSSCDTWLIIAARGL